jgi:membrane-anchored protein YejM (alkaline phosphatase superfamily)
MSVNQVLITFDSLRWDMFQQADVPYLKSLGRWRRAYTPGLYTLPAHTSFFVGKLPHTLDREDYYDSTATHSVRGRRFWRKPGLKRGKQFWRLGGVEAKHKAEVVVEGRSLIDGFNRSGYRTIGTGAMNWFNVNLPGAQSLVQDFQHFGWFGDEKKGVHEAAEQQVDWVLKEIAKSTQPFFLFVNFGETHHMFRYKGCDWFDEPNPYGNAKVCRQRQRACIEYLDPHVRTIMEAVGPCNAVLCSDHGEAMGESGLWGHGFYHQTVVEVPMLIKQADQ